MIIWWIALVPLISYLIKDRADDKRRFFKFNSSFLLLNLHLAIMPITIVEFLYSYHALHFFDLWTSILVAMLYLLFYLNVLDAKGYHFYIILTPRTPLCFISYSLVLLIYYGVYQYSNYALISFLNNKV